MKTRVYVVTLAASLFVCALANAQVLDGAGGLGGDLRGALRGNVGGAASGGLRNPGGMIHSSAQGTLGGSLSGNLDASGVRRTISDVGARTARRARRTAQAQSTAQNVGQNIGQNTAVTAGIAGSLEGSASSIKDSQVAAPPMPVAANPVPAPVSAEAVAPRKMLDVGASKQHAVALDSANQEARLLGQGSGSLTGNAGANGVNASAQGSASAGASWERRATQPSQ